MMSWEREPGNFYHLMVGLLTQQYPGQDAAWIRRRARNLVEIVNASGASTTVPLEHRDEDDGQQPEEHAQREQSDTA
jgi:hypothetical protein